MHFFSLSISLIIFLLRPTAASPQFERKCLSFRPEEYVQGSSRTVLEYVSANTTLLLADNDASCNRARQLVSVDLCRVALSIPTSSKSKISFEAWFPENWSGRFLGTGNGGLDGCIKYEDLAYTALNGFAAVGANNGKNGTGGLPFLNNSETVTDFAWRSLHTSVVAGKTLTRSFYSKAHTKSYYLGCSLGGRQGIKSAEKYPEDFDGVVAGAPAVDFNNLYSWRASFFPLTGSFDSPNFIPTAAWKTWIHDEVLRQCDLLDGVQDGILENPSICNFDPSTLLCDVDSNPGDNCLTAQQVKVVKQILSPYKYPDDKLIFPGMQPGGEIVSADGLYAGKPFSLSENWFKYVIYNDPTWNASLYTTKDAAYAASLNPANIRTYPSRLPTFQRRGGKLLMYHGQQDQQITTYNTARFYQHLEEHADGGKLDDWVRYFRISGMNHCSSGPGAWVLGQGGGAAAAGIPFDRKSNVLKALVDWVELGIAPTTIEGTKFVGDKVEAGVAFSRRHCRYPLRNKFQGGNPSSPSSWHCT